MAQLKVKLKHGLKTSETTHMDVVLREVTAGDIIDAQDESEKLVYAQNGEPMLMASPTLVSVNVLRRQIAKIGSIDGPLSLKELKKLHPNDLNLLQKKADEMDGAMSTEQASQAVAQRGRAEGDR